MIMANLTTIDKALWETTLDTLHDFETRQIDSPEVYASRTCKSGKTALSFHDIYVTGVGTLRSTLISGTNASIFNVMIFPDPENEQLIFASEIVCMGPHIHVAVVDIQPAEPGSTLPAELKGALEDKHSQVEDLQFKEEWPEWCKDYFTDRCFFGKRLSLDNLSDIESLYENYLSVYLSHMKVGDDAQGYTTQGSDHVRKYKDHHIENSPGLMYLGRLFGEEWTSKFLREGMYA